MRFELTVLGTSSAIPTKTRNLSAQVLNINEKLCLIDCADGTQLHLKRSALKTSRINNIFISHLHGDHFFGLIGLLSSMQLLGREKEMKIFGPAGLEDFLHDQLRLTNSAIDFPLRFHVLKEEQKEMLLHEPDFTVESFPVKHRIPCWGFVFRERELPRNIKKSFARKHNIPISKYNKIKEEGADFVDEKGIVYKNSDITLDPPRARSYAYAADTIYNPGMVEDVKGVDLLYHEATFAEDKIKEAKEKFHSTAKQAAMIAKAAGVKELLIGHFSARYKDISPLLTEARGIFQHTLAAEDGFIYKIHR
ncbi:MAG: ribonuclease Z [Bacteroidota bacterium]|nr:ribonuclease Z [Bacteroidota bacterium]